MKNNRIIRRILFFAFSLILSFCFVGCKEAGDGYSMNDKKIITGENDSELTKPSEPKPTEPSEPSEPKPPIKEPEDEEGDEEENTGNLKYVFTGPQDETITLSEVKSLSWASNDELEISVMEEFDSYQWFVNGEKADGASGNSITLSARDFSKGTHTVTLKVFQDGIPHTKTIYFTVN